MSPAIHTPATLLDAYEAGRVTRPELLDHLLEWRKAVSVEPAKADSKQALLTLCDAHDDIGVVNDLATAIEMMAMDISGNQRDAFIRVAQAIKSNAAQVGNRIHLVTDEMRETAEKSTTPMSPDEDTVASLAHVGAMLMSIGYALEAAEALFHNTNREDFDRGAGTLACAIAMAKRAEKFANGETVDA